MSETITETPQQLVTGRKADGRRHYAPEAKRKLIEAALQPGVSVARLALEHGLNANMLRTWITRYNRERAAAAVSSHPASMPSASTSAFVPVISERLLRPAREACLDLRFPSDRWARPRRCSTDSDALRCSGNGRYCPYSLLCELRGCAHWKGRCIGDAVNPCQKTCDGLKRVSGSRLFLFAVW